MVLTCCIVGCTNRGKPDELISFFRFPKVNERFSKSLQELQIERRNAWITAVNRKFISTDKLENLRICSCHFISGEPALLQHKTNPDWIPSLKLGYENKNERESNNRNQRYNRSVRRSNTKASKKLTADQNVTNTKSTICGESGDVHMTQVAHSSHSSDISVSASPVEEENIVSLNVVNTPENEIVRLRNRVQELEEKLSEVEEKANSLQMIVDKKPFDEDVFIGNEDLLKHFTGIPNLKFFHFLLDNLKDVLFDVTNRSSLNPFQALALTLMKLRLDHTFIELGYHFKISDESASKIFRKVVILLAFTFQEALHWPTRDAIIKSTPDSFKNSKFGTSVTAIIDCFEIRSEKPTGVKAQSKVFSTYKHYHTIKYMISITSCGFISFITNGWGGHSSDPTIFAECGFAELLQKGDVVLADRGFGKSCEQLCAAKGALLVTPSFTKGKAQLHPLEYEFSKIVGSYRIHVERVIGQLKNKFAILRGPVCITMLQYSYSGTNLFDYIVRVCSILNNMFDLIVK